MIKEIMHELANTKTGFKFEHILIKSDLISPIVMKVPLHQEVQYFKENFDKIKCFNLEISKKNQDVDVPPINLWSGFFCFSLKFKKVFENKLKGYWYSTNHDNYFIFLLDNCIDALDKEKTTIEYNINHLDKPYRYNYIENETFKSEVEKNEYLFTMPEFYGKYFITPKFEKLFMDNNFKGFQFFNILNIKRKDGSEFDMFRRKRYDNEGNCLE